MRHYFKSVHVRERERQGERQRQGLFKNGGARWHVLKENTKHVL